METIPPGSIDASMDQSLRQSRRHAFSQAGLFVGMLKGNTIATTMPSVWWAVIGPGEAVRPMTPSYFIPPYISQYAASSCMSNGIVTALASSIAFAGQPVLVRIGPGSPGRFEPYHQESLSPAKEPGDMSRMDESGLPDFH
jgi:hypothetical protein